MEEGRLECREEQLEEKYRTGCRPPALRAHRDGRACMFLLLTTEGHVHGHVHSVHLIVLFL